MITAILSSMIAMLCITSTILIFRRFRVLLWCFRLVLLFRDFIVLYF
nr:MAG TPA: hypothetical protein [Microviridae sp.]